MPLEMRLALPYITSFSFLNQPCITFMSFFCLGFLMRKLDRHMATKMANLEVELVALVGFCDSKRDFLFDI
jgi:hypothetical protein